MDLRNRRRSLPRRRFAAAIDPGVETPPTDLSEAAIARLVDAEGTVSVLAFEKHHVAGFQADPAQAQAAGQAVAAGPGLLQRHVGHLLCHGLFDGTGHRQRCLGAAVAPKPPRLHDGGAVVDAGLDIGETQGSGQLGFLRPRDLQQVGLGFGLHQVVPGHRGSRRPLPHAKPQAAIALHRIDAEGGEQAFQRIARRHGPIDDEAVDQALHIGDVDIRHAMRGTDRRDEPPQGQRPRCARSASGRAPVGAVGPDVARAPGTRDRAARPRSSGGCAAASTIRPP